MGIEARRRVGVHGRAAIRVWRNESAARLVNRSGRVCKGRTVRQRRRGNATEGDGAGTRADGGLSGSQARGTAAAERGEGKRWCRGSGGQPSVYTGAPPVQRGTRRRCSGACAVPLHRHAPPLWRGMRCRCGGARAARSLGGGLSRHDISAGAAHDLHNTNRGNGWGGR